MDREDKYSTEKVYVLKSKSGYFVCRKSQNGLLLMELIHGGPSERQFYYYESILEWKQAGTLEEMYKVTQ